MVQERIPMKTIIEVLKLKYQNECTDRRIARQLGISRPTIKKYLDLALSFGIGQWPIPGDQDGGMERLRNCLYPEKKISVSGYPLPDWSEVEKELNSGKKTGVTRQLLWQEYRLSHPKGLSYSQYCAHYAAYRKNRDFRIHLPHAPGEELYVDYSGPKVTIYPVGEKPFSVSIFIGVMGNSAYTFAYATKDMTTPSWIEAHQQMFRYLGGVPLALIPDCTKTAVILAHRYDPKLNRTYKEMSEHFGFTIAPARPLSPRDKGAAESGVLAAQRALLAPLRDIRYTSLAEFNRALRIRLDAFNRTPFQKRPYSRAEIFEAEDRPALGPLPEEPFETENWIQCRVHLDYHIAIDRFFYSVPFRLVREKVDVRLTAKTVEVFYREERVASHLRAADPRHLFHTLREHMPPAHQSYLDQSKEGFLKRAEAVGPHVVEFFQSLFSRRHYPPQAYRTCLGILSLLKDYPSERLNDACRMGLLMQTGSYRDIQGILKVGADLERSSPEGVPSVPAHENIRGQAYYTPAGERGPEGEEQKSR